MGPAARRHDQAPGRERPLSRGARRRARARPRAGRRRARRPLRGPGGDGADPRRRRGRLLHRPGVEPAHSSHRRALSEAVAGHGCPLSRRPGSGGHHSGRRGGRAPALPRRRHSSPSGIDRPRAHPDRPAASSALRRRGDWRRRGARDRSGGDSPPATAPRAKATGRRAACCAASRSPCASPRPGSFCGPPIPLAGPPAPAAAIPARRSGRRTDRKRSPSSPGRRGPTAAAAAA